MKKLNVFVVTLVIGLVSISAFAQEEITDDQLYRYALMQEVIGAMKKDISVEVNNLIKAQEGMTGQRYKELATTKGDEAKLQGIEAKDWEIKFLDQVNKFMDDRKETIKSVNSELATKMVGDKGKVYKRIKEELTSNEDIKSRYSAISNSLSAKAITTGN